MKILVTGGTGFVGQRVVKDLLAQGHAVRLWTRRPVDVPGAETCHVSDLDNMAAMSDAVAGMDAICHLAGRAHVIGATPADHEAQFEKVNVEWTSKLAEASFLAGAKRFVFVSSIGAVGTSSPPGQPLTEQTECRPVTPYGRSKLKAEQILRGLAERHGGEWVAVRPPLVHGKDAPGNMARLTRLVRKGLPLPLGSVKNAQHDTCGQSVQCAAGMPDASRCARPRIPRTGQQGLLHAGHSARDWQELGTAGADVQLPGAFASLGGGTGRAGGCRGSIDRHVAGG